MSDSATIDIRNNMISFCSPRSYHQKSTVFTAVLSLGESVMAQGPFIYVHAWDPYHGDRNNRHPRLGAPVPRRVPTDLWRTFPQIQPAMHNNGIFGWTSQRAVDTRFSDAPIELTQARRAFGQEP